jgi:hypothetical protein
MKINKNILHVPPYISTSWDNIISIFVQENLLIVILKNGTKIEIPDLNANLMELIFDTHAQILESNSKPKTSISFGLPMLSPGGNLESLSSVMQHDPSQKDSPDLPPDIIKKIANIAKLFTEETNAEIPMPEKNCNCMHCQIAKALQMGLGINHENLDDEVSDEDLRFKNWEIQEEGSNLFTVINPLDQNEHYSVFLGEPIGCTCGKKNCEHIKAVLKS